MHRGRYCEAQADAGRPGQSQSNQERDDRTVAVPLLLPVRLQGPQFGGFYSVWDV